MFTEAQLKRIREIQWALDGVPGHDTKITKEDVGLLLARVHDLDGDNCSCAGEIIEWTRDRLDEDLRSKRVWLEEAVENVRIAELMVREAERALAVVQALKDGGMFEAGEEINARWDAMRALYESQGMLPVPEPAQIEAPEPEPEKAEIRHKATKEDFADLPPESVDQLSEDHPAKAQEPPAVAAQPRPAPPPKVEQREQEERLYAALKTLAAGADEVQARLAVLAEESGIPKGSCHAVLQRLQTAGRITIIKPPPKNNVPQPNIYRFASVFPKVYPTEPVAPEPSNEEPKSYEAPLDPMNLPDNPALPGASIEKLASAWGAKVRPTGSVSQSAPLRERILGVLAKSASTTSGLASMLDVKELAICQTLDAMKNEGTVRSDEMPEAGRRAQLWRPAA